jgi:hypothetical protein
MKKKIATLLASVAMAGALFAGPALAWEPYHHDAHWLEIHRPQRVYTYSPVYGPRYAYNAFNPMMPRPAHWQLIEGHWRWVRG